MERYRGAKTRRLRILPSRRVSEVPPRSAIEDPMRMFCVLVADAHKMTLDDERLRTDARAGRYRVGDRE